MREKKKRKLWFRALKGVMKCRYKAPAFIYVDEKFNDGSLILSNHEGTDAPMALEIYFNRSIRLWGTGEMNSGLRKLYKYQTRVYYHEKKHWNIHLARLFCLIASPLTNWFYKGFDLISVYPDARFLTTVRKTITALNEDDNVVIFPEDSSEGYTAELKGFFAGFVTLCESALKKGVDLPVLSAYFKKQDNVYLFDKPINYSALKEKYVTKDAICQYMCDRCNALYKLELPSDVVSKARSLKDGVTINSTTKEII